MTGRAGRWWTRLWHPTITKDPNKLGLWDCPVTRHRCPTILTCEYVCRRAFLSGGTVPGEAPTVQSACIGPET